MCFNAKLPFSPTISDFKGIWIVLRLFQTCVKNSTQCITDANICYTHSRTSEQTVPKCHWVFRNKKICTLFFNFCAALHPNLTGTEDLNSHYWLIYCNINCLWWKPKKKSEQVSSRTSYSNVCLPVSLKKGISLSGTQEESSSMAGNYFWLCWFTSYPTLVPVLEYCGYSIE